MFYALVDNKKVEAFPKGKGICPSCNSEVIAKCGEIKVWHWAHTKEGNCDSWSEPETMWHKNWKLTFGIETNEVKISKGDKWHIADIKSINNVIIELQNSPIQREIIREREEFYGERMLWIINGEKFKDNFHISDYDVDLYSWALPNNKISNKEGIKFFTWFYPKTSWKDSKRNVFIDFNDGYLFWVKKGIGEKKGQGKFIIKEQFIVKYGGDFNKHLQLFRNITFTLNVNELKVKGFKEKKLYIVTYIRFRNETKCLEIYFDDEDEIFKAKDQKLVKINGNLNFEEYNDSLQLFNSKFML
ncbi:hypothetical protein KMW28_06070 [Flammeovirga yaeyamensis]|uniref:Competence protein CoiA-like N-terminal domain-containing protein n=1 Tax=Flammeovirga yaeyamensis TaxID=367791 RepID=A0AAX1N6C9_9BACT|nr:competence protein CoiA family protein [Flammeovirga yaeyamensis]MBB3697737.1 hypothetical protein [Flammeovirga yaeyamensis]NMF35906.1 hypothetical protein [Flammeovirga yaeyamensis]QWG03144.1 hypothetical protein KMW28_06070 [Flammeovirga yaeyamensis]